MNGCLGIINLDENDSKMGDLVTNRVLASIPIAGRYRIIDFILSNMTNSGMEAIGVFTKNKSRSLIDHLSNGRPWDLHRKKDGLRIFNFGDEDPIYDDVHNFVNNIEFIKKSKKRYVLIAPAYMICNISYKDLINYHKKSDNDVTVVYKKVNDANNNFIDCGILNINNKNRVVNIKKNIGKESISNIDMEMYIMRTDLFMEIAYEGIKSGMYRKVKEFIRQNLNNLNVGAFEFKGYLACINSTRAYFNASLSFLDKHISKELFYKNPPIYTKIQDEFPTRYTEDSCVNNSIIANGSYIEGTVKNCIIGRKVNIGKGTILENCVIMQNTDIGNNVIMKNVITHKGSLINSNNNIIGDGNLPIIIEKEKSIV
ncbi:glucose-1-phosphate adenylyltransferase subunit GlgD [Clostridium chauvoei]|uniref:Glucose-1-phosphate adenylyltransferase subunit GlgD n=2 Tax=Clostridium chauvoei TaxID=46867 RepID=A0ABD4RKU6_9CLOT|nr:glucose-1-phosphate adenylyltransferase subunit GlgD [Clostridium chauvoei]ATD54017.1 glucose-1-phosphate adenylyltransferase subunit GlgD [Clostridium chauvoei]ATD58530.1 glucose-1-phosphate adenylyltransferase subunit GlgD [Clostridium chauvoei]MBX7281819.1 glucose-1-phosphate adenylyltransferase subunit GlgD [Clostridium chauvoei]MBX7284337.1 glucose-1-phosphate adenylyltransferase subunit GlgD [Clostridium chauvoei]MBX7286856.1 glucose-1-phosphate adenylyltransferase subunit GlgD [Clost